MGYIDNHKFDFVLHPFYVSDKATINEFLPV